jgi:L-ascorbate metabolism protein UlaG (beta-lactamase superfamily)
MYVANSHLRIMQSFITAPEVHVTAVKNPLLRGGPFIKYDARRVEDVKRLLDKTKQETSMLQLAEALKALDEMLSNEANGCSLEPVYQKIPDSLKGYVELVYDLNNNPSFRLIEGLLYRSVYYKPSLQSIALSLIDRDARPFAFSTPKLDDEDHLRLSIPFSQKGLDELFKMKYDPQPLGYIKEVLDIKDDEHELFTSFFTENGSQISSKFDGDAVRIRYFGHACLLIDSKNASILCDPVIGYKYDNGFSRYTYADLPGIIDYVVITHSHQDHCMFETLLQVRHKIKNVIVPKNNGGALADPSLKLVLQKIGFDSVTEIDEMETISVDGVAITGLPFLGEHADLNIRSKLAYLIQISGKSILMGADSNNLEPRLYEYIHEMSGDIDALFLGMECDGAPLSWVYGPLLTRPLNRKIDQSRRLNGSNYEKAREIVLRLRPNSVYVYAMGQEPWLTYLTSIKYTEESRPIVESNELIHDCRTRGITSERLFGQKEIFL